jgi:hypothetical protein
MTLLSDVSFEIDGYAFILCIGILLTSSFVVRFTLEFVQILTNVMYARIGAFWRAASYLVYTYYKPFSEVT